MHSHAEFYHNTPFGCFEGKMDLKSKGERHYKTGGIEPIDLFRDGGMLWDYALGNIIKYAFRNRRNMCEGKNWCVVGDEMIKDMEKIIHYAEMVIDLCGGKENE